MQAIAKKRDGICLSKDYTNSFTHLKWKCSRGHIWKAVPNSINTGSWCPECAGKKRRTIHDMHVLAAKNNGKCLSKKFYNILTPLLWECSEGHQWKTMPSNIIHSQAWCPQCAGTKKKTIEDMHILAAKRGGKCLSKKYANILTPLLWQCKQGHTWKSRPTNLIHQNTWCHVCSKYGKLTIDQMEQIAVERGGLCLSKTYINTSTKLQWKCEHKHTWWATPSDVKYSKSWCPFCARSAPITIEKLMKIARQRGGQCLSKKYKVGKKLLFKCSDGHIWKTTANCITTGSWCHRCGNYNEEKCRDIFQKLLNREFYKDREVLNGLELDGYCKSLKLAFEYNGQQHYNPKFYFHESLKGFRKLKRNDALKRRSCKSKGICLIVIPYTKAGKTKSLIQYIALQLRKKGFSLKRQPEKLNVSRITGNISQLKLLQKIADKKGIQCLSTEYINIDSKLKWRCSTGHEWETTGSQIKYGNAGCPACSGKKKHTIEFAQQLAKKHEGKCLSKRYKNVGSSLLWECKNGHRWKTSFSNVFHGELWCQKCIIESKFDELIQIITSKGGKCLSLSYPKNGKKMAIQCSKKHKWKTTPAVIRAGYWCPQCNVDSQKLTIEDLKQTAINRGFDLLTFDYYNNTSKLLWQCKLGHKWYSSVNSIRNRKSDCPYCRWLKFTTDPYEREQKHQKFLNESKKARLKTTFNKK